MNIITLHIIEKYCLMQNTRANASVTHDSRLSVPYSNKIRIVICFKLRTRKRPYMEIKQTPLPK